MFVVISTNTGIQIFSCLIILKAFGWMNMILTESFVMYHLPSNTNSTETETKNLQNTLEIVTENDT